MSPPTFPVPKVLFTPEFVQDPYPTYRKLLDEGPLHYVELSGGMWAVWAVFGYADCFAATRDARFSVKRTGRLLSTLPQEQQTDFQELVRMMGMWMIFMDAAEHTRLRKLMNKEFSPAVVESLRPKIEAVVDRMLEPLAHGSEADLMAAVANPMPVQVIARMLGVPETMYAHFMEWSEAIANFMGNPDRTANHARVAQEAVLALTDFFRQAVAERRRNKGDDLISLLIDIEADGETLSEEELDAKPGREWNVGVTAECGADAGAAEESGDNPHGGGRTPALRKSYPVHSANREGRSGNLRDTAAARTNDSVYVGSGKPGRATVQRA